MKELASALRLLGDESRLRALRMLRREELNAGELARILGLAPSAVSRQVALLRDAGLVAERRSGRFVWFQAAASDTLVAGLDGALGAMVDDAPDTHGDAARLADVLRGRHERQMGSGTARPFVPGRSWAAWSRAVSSLVPAGLRVVDLGSGDGALALEMARFAATVVGIDCGAALVKRAKAAAAKAGAANVSFRRADIECLPLDDAAFDLAVLSQSLHATADPASALAEAARVLRPGGRVIVLELQPHHEDWVRERLGHQRLGFAPAELTDLLDAAGFVDVRVERQPARGDEPFRPLLATGTRPEAAS